MNFISRLHIKFNNWRLFFLLHLPGSVCVWISFFKNKRIKKVWMWNTWLTPVKQHIKHPNGNSGPWNVCPHGDYRFTHHETPHSSRPHCSTCVGWRYNKLKPIVRLLRAEYSSLLLENTLLAISSSPQNCAIFCLNKIIASVFVVRFRCEKYCLNRKTCDKS